MCRICTSNVSRGSGEMVSGASGGEFGIIRLVPIRLVAIISTDEMMHSCTETTFSLLYNDRILYAAKG